MVDRIELDPDVEAQIAVKQIGTGRYGWRAVFGEVSGLQIEVASNRAARQYLPCSAWKEGPIVCFGANEEHVRARMRVEIMRLLDRKLGL